MSHTPGPWFVTNEDPKGVQVHGIGGGFVCRAAWMVGVSRSGSEGPSPDAVTVVMLPSRTTARANARLIAAAPEMLELLEEAIMYVEECEAFHKPECRTLSKRIRAAIAKASDVAPLTQ